MCIAKIDPRAAQLLNNGAGPRRRTKRLPERASKRIVAVDPPQIVTCRRRRGDGHRRPAAWPRRVPIRHAAYRRPGSGQRRTHLCGGASGQTGQRRKMGAPACSAIAAAGQRPVPRWPFIVDTFAQRMAGAIGSINTWHGF